MRPVIDFHTHAFPESIAGRAIATLETEAKGHARAYLDGTVASLVESMDRSGIEQSVVCSIATKPSQFDPILEWSKAIRSERISPFASVHPADADSIGKIRIIRAEGFKGIKMHPYYQDFVLDEPRMFPLYEEMVRQNLILVVHTGYDVAFPRIRRADPAKIVAVAERYPELKFVATHLGAWEQWAEVETLLAGKRIYMEISFALEYLDTDPVREIMLRHPKEYLLFGSDSPWTDQAAALDALGSLGLDKERHQAFLRDNAERLLASA
jgi:predicted TIM-barrel fold metal-dependent hydrolase